MLAIPELDEPLVPLLPAEDEPFPIVLVEPVLPEEVDPLPLPMVLLEPVLFVPLELLPAMEPDVPELEVPEVELPGVRTELVASSQQLVALLPDDPELDCAAATPTLTSRAAEESVISLASFMVWPPCEG